MAQTRSYKRGMEFPHEGFVQNSIEAYFRNDGYILVVDGHVDLLCTHPETGDSWHIEAKGVTTQVGLDFRTGLGQLVQSMQHQEYNHGIAVPDTPAFRSQIAKVSSWVVSLLCIHWLLISSDGSVLLVAPNEI